nr:toprim domain-containing protein [Mesorhizobium sp.]
MKTDALQGGKRGKGDGRVIVNEHHVTAWNWKTGEKHTVPLKDGEYTPAERKEIAQRIAEDEKKRKRKAHEAAATADALLKAAKPAQHAYLINKGFPHERAFVIDANTVRGVVGKYSDYLVPEGGEKAILIPAKQPGNHVSSVQLIWEDGTKKFLANGEMENAAFRLATGEFIWFCEGYATGLSLRAALKGLHRNDCVLCCFSAYNVKVVAKSLQRKRRAIVTDNDKPQPQFEGLGTGEWYARQTGLPYLMPPLLGDDLNDLHRREGIFAVQRLLSNFVREAVL